MLTFVEEIVLLTLDDDGSVLPIRETTMEFVIAGAALMDLAFANRIDTDPERLDILDPTKTGNPMLDRAFERIAACSEPRSVGASIENLAGPEAREIREMALAKLVERGILQRRDEKILWVFQARRYPVIDGRAEREAKLRIAGVLLSDEAPDPRDVALICLADVCKILPDIFSVREIEKIGPRVEQIRRMDLIGRTIGGAVAEIERSIMIAMTQTPH